MSAVRHVHLDPDVFPEDCMQYMDSIDFVSVNDFLPGAMVEVMIGEVYSPSHFWFLRVGEEYNFAMEDMMDEMTRYYNNEGRDRVLARGAIRVGHYCSSLFEADWHRSLIVKIIDCDTVKVRHVDYGTVDTVAVSALKPLRREWGQVAAQAHRGRLAGVRPAGAGSRWPPAACAAFLARVSNLRLVANVVALDQRDTIIEMLLIDTSSEIDVCIGAELIRAGHADSRPDCSLRRADTYLYPRFEALEWGATPNYAEIRAYLRDGIALDYVDEYRAHVPLHTHDALSSPSTSTPHQLEPPSPQLSPLPSPPSPPTSPSACSTTPSPNKAQESVSQPELLTRISLLLPERPEPTKSAPLLRTPLPETVSGAEERTRDDNVRHAFGSPSPTTAPSYLSPNAAVYVPGETYPPQRGDHSPGVTLSAAACHTYRMLSTVNPEAAHWFILGALEHSTRLASLTAPPVGAPLLPPSPMHFPYPMAMHPTHPTHPTVPTPVYPAQYTPIHTPLHQPTTTMHASNFTPPAPMNPLQGMVSSQHIPPTATPSAHSPPPRPMLSSHCLPSTSIPLYNCAPAATMSSNDTPPTPIASSHPLPSTSTPALNPVQAMSTSLSHPIPLTYTLSSHPLLPTSMPPYNPSPVMPMPSSNPTLPTPTPSSHPLSSTALPSSHPTPTISKPSFNPVSATPIPSSHPTSLTPMSSNPTLPASLHPSTSNAHMLMHPQSLMYVQPPPGFGYKML